MERVGALSDPTSGDTLSLDTEIGKYNLSASFWMCTRYGKLRGDQDGAPRRQGNQAYGILCRGAALCAATPWREARGKTLIRRNHRFQDIGVFPRAWCQDDGRRPPLRSRIRMKCLGVLASSRLCVKNLFRLRCNIGMRVKI